jgi:hypothetical protein
MYIDIAYIDVHMNIREFKKRKRISFGTELVVARSYALTFHLFRTHYR